MSVARLKPRPKLIKRPEGPFRLHIGNKHQARQGGFIGLDDEPAASVDFVVDTRQLPWPINDDEVDYIFAAFYFHRLTRDERYTFMDECWRVLKPGGQVALLMPHASSMRAITDPLACWPPLCEASFLVYSRTWRENERMTGLPLSCDFNQNIGVGHSLDPDVKVRNDDFQDRAKKHWVNAIMDFQVTLTKERSE